MYTKDKSSATWSLEKLQAYFAYCKQFQPYLSKDASVILSTYYQKQRQGDHLNMARTTVRLLQSAIRYRATVEWAVRKSHHELTLLI